MQVQFCGTRGSTPVSSAEQSRYGGYTACIALAHTGEPPTIILDAGTGLQQLSLTLRGQAFCGTILLSHLHWDHTHGMPFFRSGTIPGNRVDVYLPEQGVDPKNCWHGRSRPRISRSARRSSATTGPSMPSSQGIMSSRAFR